MFSKTVRRGNIFVLWKERPIPSRQILWGGMGVMSIPLKISFPSSLERCPVIRLKRVVFPAPLGPMMEQISPLFTEKLTPFTARKPSKAFLQIFNGQDYRFHLAKIRRLRKKPRIPPGKKKRRRARIVPMMSGQYWVLEVTAMRR